MIINFVQKQKIFFKYCFAGGVAAITDLGIFFILNEIFNIYYIFAIPIAFFIAAIVNYSLQRKFTFKSKYKKKRKQFSVFLLIMIIGFFINASLTIMQVELFNVWPTLARFIAILIGTLYSYYANSRITFNLK
jgi:putative flippase GtrA